MTEPMFKQVTWDIAGVCNAACRYCPSGSKNLLGQMHKKMSSFLKPEAFADGLDYLTKQGVIVPDKTDFGLYSWGEPFAHPRFGEMLKIIADRGFVFALSTNASLLKHVPPETLWRLRAITFSMPGFSQESYDRQHGFKFEEICANIEEMVAPIRTISPNTEVAIVFHLYKFNIKEVQAAIEFCKKLDIWFIPTVAILTGMTMPLYQAGYDLSEFFTEHWDKIKKLQPDPWECPQYDQLVIDEYGNVVQCCVTDRFTPGAVVDHLKDVDFSKLRDVRRSYPVCTTCVRSGTGYLAHCAGHDSWNLIKENS